MLTQPGIVWLGELIQTFPLRLFLLNATGLAEDLTRQQILAAEVAGAGRALVNNLTGYSFAYTNNRGEWQINATLVPGANVTANKLAVIANGGTGKITLAVPATATGFAAASGLFANGEQVLLANAAGTTSTFVTITGFSAGTYSYASNPIAAGLTTATSAAGSILACQGFSASASFVAGNSYSLVFSSAGYNP